MYAQVSAAVLGIRADPRRLAQSRGPRRSRSRRDRSRRRRFRAATRVRSRGSELGGRPGDRGGPTARRERRCRRAAETAATARQAAVSEHAERRGPELAEEDGGGRGAGDGRGRGHRETRHQDIPEAVSPGENRRGRRGAVQPDQHGRGPQGRHGQHRVRAGRYGGSGRGRRGHIPTGAGHTARGLKRTTRAYHVQNRAIFSAAILHGRLVSNNNDNRFRTHK